MGSRKKLHIQRRIAPRRKYENATLDYCLPYIQLPLFVTERVGMEKQSGKTDGL